MRIEEPVPLPLTRLLRSASSSSRSSSGERTRSGVLTLGSLALTVAPPPRELAPTERTGRDLGAGGEHSSGLVTMKEGVGQESSVRVRLGPGSGSCRDSMRGKDGGGAGSGGCSIGVLVGAIVDRKSYSHELMHRLMAIVHVPSPPRSSSPLTSSRNHRRCSFQPVFARRPPSTSFPRRPPRRTRNSPATTLALGLFRIPPPPREL